MKVRIEFQSPDPGKDCESMYDAVEFTTIYAESYQAWGDALSDFMRATNRIHYAILLEAMFLADGLPENFAQSSWVKRRISEIISIRDELSDLINEHQRLDDKEQS
jgi:hypothetical protein